MGNTTHMDFFKSRERLRYIEAAAYWRGYVNRQDIVEAFGLSLAQASADMQAYIAQNPAALAYDLRAKCYTWAARARPVLHKPDFAGALLLFGADSAREAAGAASVPSARFAFPCREAAPAVQQAVFQATLAGEIVAIHYHSLDSGEAAERRIAPRAFGFDGFRWHVRAWCFEHGEYRDFVLGRIEKAAAPSPLLETLPADTAWTREVTLLIRANPKLKPDTRRALELDFNMTGGALRFTVREALAFYAENHFRALWSPREKKSWFEVSRL